MNPRTGGAETQGWTEEAWSYEGPVELGAEPSGGPSSRQQSNGFRYFYTLQGEQEGTYIEDENWGEFLAEGGEGERPPFQLDAGASRGWLRSTHGVGPARFGSSWMSLVSLGQQLVRQQEEAGRDVVRLLRRGLDSALRDGNSGLFQPLMPVSSDTDSIPRGLENTNASADSNPQVPTSRVGSGGRGGRVSTREKARWPGLVNGRSSRSSVEGLPGTATSASGISSAEELTVLPLRQSRSGEGASRPTSGVAAQGLTSQLEEEEGMRVREEMLRVGWPRRTRWGRADGARDAPGTGCWSKFLEVLPVMAVVCILALGTVLYFTLVDGVLAQFKAPFSLSCRVEDGVWARSPSRASGTAPRVSSRESAHEPAPFAYDSSCPYIRDEFNCAKYGLPQVAAASMGEWEWQPDGCSLPPLTAAGVLDALTGRRVGFVGDMTVANQFDSFVCLLAGEEAPRVMGWRPETGASGRNSEQAGKSGGSVPLGPRGRAAAPAGAAAPSPPQSIQLAPRWGASWPLWLFGRGGRGAGATGDEVEAASVEVLDNGVSESVGAVAATGKVDAPTHTNSAGSEAAGRRTVAFFASRNVTVAFFHSPFLVKAEVSKGVNASACAAAKVALQQQQQEQQQQQQWQDRGQSTPKGWVGGRGLTASQRLESGGAPPGGASSALPVSGAHEGLSSAGGRDERGVHAAAEPSGPGEGFREVGHVCYPNSVDLGVPDPLWADGASGYDFLVLGSGRGWTEEAVEREGLGISVGGRRQQGLSLEGLTGEWAYPYAMASVARWLDDRANFRGTAVFRTFSPGHLRRECAGRMVLRRDQVGGPELGDALVRYNAALRKALVGTRHVLLDVTLMSLERGDGHPWMSSPSRPKADCGNWCLPGVPDAWNRILVSIFMDVLRRDVRP